MEWTLGWKSQIWTFHEPFKTTTQITTSFFQVKLLINQMEVFPGPKTKNASEKEPNEARWIAGPGVQGESDVPQRLIGGKVGALDTGVPVEGVHRPVEGVDRSTGVLGGGASTSGSHQFLQSCGKHKLRKGISYVIPQKIESLASSQLSH